MFVLPGLSLPVVGMTELSKCRPHRSPSRAVLISALLLTLAGCRSNTVVLDKRPAWVVEAEQRLKQEPAFGVDKRKAHDSRPLWGSQPTEDAAKPEDSSTARKSRFPAGKPKTSPTGAQPDAVSWSETKITVEVEN